MKQIKIVRLTEHGGATRGVLLVDEEMICATLEPPWMGNQYNISCIPEGKYKLERIMSNRLGRQVFMVADVPNRSMIEIHPGSVPSNTEGCILTGLRWGCIDGKPAVLNSVKAFEIFMQLMKGEMQADLEIVPIR